MNGTAFLDRNPAYKSSYMVRSRRMLHTSTARQMLILVQRKATNRLNFEGLKAPAVKSAKM